jgi:hypothetical protein
MNKIFVLGALVAVLAVGGVLAFLKPWNNPSPTPNQPQQKREVEKPSATSSLSLASLLSDDKSQQCDFSYTDADTGTKTSGKAYIANGVYRGTFSTTTNDKTYTGGILSDGKTMYSWDEATKKGMKMSVSAVQEMAQAMVTGAQQPSTPESPDRPSTMLDPNQTMNFTCSPWIANQALLAPPTDVEFADYGEMMESLRKMKQMPKDGTLPDASSCKVCDSLTGEAATACKRALGC